MTGRSEAVAAPARWISTQEFARLAGIDPRSAARICREATHKPWCEAALRIRRVKGRGGRAGLRYEIRDDSLPNFLLDRLIAEQDVGKTATVDPALVPAQLRQRDHRAREARRRRDILKPILLTAPGSAERFNAVELVSRETGASPATLYRWLRAWQTAGLTGLAPSLRTRSSKALVVSRTCDAALREAGVSEEALNRLRDEVDHLIKATWASQLHISGMREMARHIGKQIQLYCKAAKFPIKDAPWEPSPSRMRQFRDFRVVGIQLYDKEAVSRLMPRIRRTYEALAPMSVVFVDVKLADIYVKSAKGESGRPMLVAFYDAATRRVFSHFSLLLRGAGPTGEAVGAALCEMLTHPDWGIPACLYTDNGSEMHELDVILSKLALADSCPVIRALPHNPQAKPIEGVFANLNRLVFSKMRGFTGGKPRKLRTLLSDRDRPTYPGSWSQFVQEYTCLMDDYHRTRRSGPLSPTQLYHKKRAEMNHKPRLCSPEQLTIALGTAVTRQVRQGAVKIDAHHYTCPKLYETVGDEKVRVVIPPSGVGTPLMLFDGEVFELSRDGAYDPRDIAGAIESTARKNAYNGAAFRRYLELGGRYANPADQVRLASHWLTKLRNVTHPVFAERDPDHADAPWDRTQDRKHWSKFLAEVA